MNKQGRRAAYLQRQYLVDVRAAVAKEKARACLRDFTRLFGLDQLDSLGGAFTLGTRVFHQKFGNGNVTAIDGNKLTIQFDHAGEKRVIDSFVVRGRG